MGAMESDGDDPSARLLTGVCTGVCVGLSRPSVAETRLDARAKPKQLKNERGGG